MYKLYRYNEDLEEDVPVTNPQEPIIFIAEVCVGTGYFPIDGFEGTYEELKRMAPRIRRALREAQRNNDAHLIVRTDYVYYNEDTGEYKWPNTDALLDVILGL